MNFILDYYYCYYSFFLFFSFETEFLFVALNVLELFI